MQTVNDLLTMYVGAASQHELRTTFVPREEAVRFDKEIVFYWSQLAGRDVTSPLFHLPLRMGGLGVGSAAQRHAAAPWTAWQSIIPPHGSLPHPFYAASYSTCKRHWPTK